VISGAGRWYPSDYAPCWLSDLCVVSTCSSATQAALRSYLSARIYGWRFAVRFRYGSFSLILINCAATAQAIHQFVIARIFGSRLKWRKTEHVYDASVVRVPNRPRIGEMLVRLRYISMTDLEELCGIKPHGRRIGEYLVPMKKIQEVDLVKALASQSTFRVNVRAIELSEQWLPPAEIRSAESPLPEPAPRPNAQA